MAISLGTIFGDVRLRLNGLQEDGAKVGETVGEVKTKLAEMGTTGTEAVTQVGDSLTGLQGTMAETATAAEGVGAAAEDAGTKGSTGMKAIGQGAQEAEGGILGAAEAVATLAKQFLEMFLVAKVLETIGEFIHGVFDETNAWQTAQSQMNATLQSTHNAAGMTAEALTKMSEALAANTAYTKEDVMSAQNLLLTFTNIKSNVFPQATQATLDLATALHTDLKSASILVGKALNDPVKGVTALQRVGVTLDEQQKKAVKQYMAVGNVAAAQGIILGELTKETGKSAEAYGNTLPGMIARAQKAFADIQQEIGDAVRPALEGLVGAIVPLFENLQTLVKEGLDKARDAFHAIRNAVGPFFDSLRKNEVVMAVVKPLLIGLAVAGTILAIAMVGAIIPALWGFVTAAWAAVAPVLAAVAPFAAVIGLLVAIGLGLKYAYEHFKPFHEWVDKTWKAVQQLWQQGLKQLQDAFEKLKPHLVQAGEFLKKLWNEGLKLLVEWLPKIGAFLQEHIGAALQFILPYIVQGWQALQKFWEQIAPKLIPALQGLMNIIRPIAIIIGVLLVGAFILVRTELEFLFTVWKAAWPAILQVLQGVWNVIVGVIKIAWAIITGLFKIGLDLLSGNWSGAWNDLKDMLGGIWDGILSILKGAWQIVGGLFQAAGAMLGAAWGFIWDHIKGIVQGAVTWIRDRLSDGFHAILNIVLAPIRFIAGLFVWLYNHNRYFQMLVDFIRAKFEEAKAIVIAVWTVISTWIHDKIQEAHDIIVAVVTAIRDRLQELWDKITGAVKAAWDKVTGIFTGAKSTMSDATGNIIHAIMDPILQLGGKLLQAAKNAIAMFVQGILSGVGAVANAIKQVAGPFASILGFHSPPKEGPAHDSDHWMGNFIGMMADGIDKNAPKLRDAAARAATHLRNGLAVGDNFGIGDLIGSGGSLSIDGGSLSSAAGIGLGGNHTEYHTHNVDVPVTVQVTAETADGDPEQAGASFGYSVGTQIGAALIQAGYRSNS